MSLAPSTGFNKFQDGRLKKQVVSQAGPSNYQSASRPTVTFDRLVSIDSVYRVKVLNKSAYDVRIISVDGNVVTYAVFGLNHASHAHDINIPGGGPAASLSIAGNAFSDAGAGGTVLGGTPGGIDPTVLTAHDAEGLSEVSDGTDLSSAAFIFEAEGI